MKKSLLKIAFSIVLSLSCFVMKAQIVDRDLTNLVIFVRFSNDSEITHDFPSIDSMFNGKTPGYLSISNFYDALTYGHIHYNTVYPNNIQNNQIISYQDEMPRGYFEPYSPSNPIGYTGEWASILWPHMEYFPHDSIDHPVQINGIRPNTFNLEFEGSPQYFTANVFRHEMGHSLNLPDLYHYINYQNVRPAGSWDMMEGNSYANHTAAIFKSKILHVCDDPIQITEDGDYTLNSVGSSQSQNCYYIKSTIDSTQWFVFEYRRYLDLFEDGVDDTQYESFTVYPNPATDRVFVKGENMKQVEIINTIGQTLISQTVDNDLNTEISISDLPDGIYLILIRMDNNETVTKKIVKR